MALLELTLYRAVEAEAQFSPFSPRPSRAGGYSLQLTARLGEGNLAAKSRLAAQAKLVPSSVCKAAHGSARLGKLCNQGKWLQQKMQTEQICLLFLYGFLPQKNTLKALKPLNIKELFQKLCFDVTGQIHLVA